VIFVLFHVKYRTGLLGGSNSDDVKRVDDLKRQRIEVVDDLKRQWIEVVEFAY
jgi:hypothetical protein